MAITNIVINEQRPRLKVQQNPGHPLAMFKRSVKGSTSDTLAD
jgi:hypothetical protein